MLDIIETRTASPVGIRALAAGLFWPEDAKVLAIWGYFDESGEHDPKTGHLLNMSIGGVYSSLDRWQSLETEWTRILAREGIDSFHMKEFESWKAPFDFKLGDGGRDLERHNRILNDLLDLMIEHIDGYYGFGAVSQFAPGQEAVTDRQLLMDCAIGVVKNAVETARLYYGGEAVNLMFARQNRISLDELQRQARDYDYRGAAIGTITVGSPNGKAPLQCADILAYEIAHAQRYGRSERYPFQRLRTEAAARGRSFSFNWGPVRQR